MPPVMLRFDPTLAEHSKFVEAKGKKRSKVKNNSDLPAKRMKSDANEENESNNEPPVSMEHFYEIRGDLKKSLGSDGFSLLSMFNRTSGNNLKENSLKHDESLYEEKMIAKNSLKHLNDFNPFQGDSSDEEADETNRNESLKLNGTNSTKEILIKHEPFFILDSSDARISGKSFCQFYKKLKENSKHLFLTDGLSFFVAPEELTESENKTNYDDDHRQELKNIVKRKIKKSIQNALPRHAKANKRFRMFTKNL